MFKLLKLSIVSIILALGLLNPVFDMVGVFDGGFLGSSEVFAGSEGMNKDQEALYKKCMDSGLKDEAQCTAKAELKGTGPVNETQKKMFDAIIPIIEIIFYLNWLAISFLSVLMNNLMVYHPNIVDFLHNMWLIFRNISNVLFALVLVAIAIKNIFTGTEALGTAMKNFVIALILINFSWFFVKLIVDVGTVATHIVYRIPSEYGTNTDTGGKSIVAIKYNFVPTKDNTLTDSNNLVCFIEEDSAKKAKNAYENDMKNNVGTGTQCSDGIILRTGQAEEGQLNTSKDTSSNQSMVSVYTVSYANSVNSKKYVNLNSSSIAGSMAINYLKLENLHKISSGNKTWSTLIFESIFSVLFGLMSAVVFIALTFALLERLVVLWLLIMISPLAALSYGLEGLGFSLGEFDVKSLFQKLLNYAVVIPAGVGIVFVMTFLIMGEMMSAKINLNAVGGGMVTTSAISSFGSSWKLLLEIATLGILWVGSFYVMKKAEFVAQGITEGIRTGAQGLAKLGGEQLLYAPIMPFGKTTGTNIPFTLGGILDKAKTDLTSGGWKGQSKKFDEAREKESRINLDQNIDMKAEFDQTKDGSSARRTQVERILTDIKTDQQLTPEKIEEVKKVYRTAGITGNNLDAITAHMIQDITPETVSWTKILDLAVTKNSTDYTFDTFKDLTNVKAEWLAANRRNEILGNFESGNRLVQLFLRKKYDTDTVIRILQNIQLGDNEDDIKIKINAG